EFKDSRHLRAAQPARRQAGLHEAPAAHPRLCQPLDQPSGACSRSRVLREGRHPVSAKPTTAMVLAAGLGKRMRPLTETTPKPLIPVAGKTLLDWGLDTLGAAGVEMAIVNVHYLGEQI